MTLPIHFKIKSWHLLWCNGHFSIFSLLTIQADALLREIVCTVLFCFRFYSDEFDVKFIKFSIGIDGLLNKKYIVVLSVCSEERVMENQEIETRLQRLINADKIVNKQLAIKTKRIYKRLNFFGKISDVNIVAVCIDFIHMFSFISQQMQKQSQTKNCTRNDASWWCRTKCLPNIATCMHLKKRNRYTKEIKTMWTACGQAVKPYQKRTFVLNWLFISFLQKTLENEVHRLRKKVNDFKKQSTKSEPMTDHDQYVFTKNK